MYVLFIYLCPKPFFFLLRQSLASWPWLVWYPLHRLGWSWIFWQFSCLDFLQPASQTFICSSQWFYKTGALFCWCKNSNRKEKHESSIPFIVNNCRTRIQTKHQSGLIAELSQQGLVILNKVTCPRNRTMWPNTGGWGILLKEWSTHRDWPFSSVLRGYGRRIRLFNNTVWWFGPKEPQKACNWRPDLQCSGAQRWTLWEVTESWGLGPCHISKYVQLGAHWPRAAQNSYQVAQNKILNLLSTLWGFFFGITQLISWFLSVTFVDDGVMLQYQKVGHVCCDGLTLFLWQHSLEPPWGLLWGKGLLWQSILYCLCLIAPTMHWSPRNDEAKYTFPKIFFDKSQRA